MTFCKIIGSIGIIFSSLIIYLEIQKYERQKINQINSFILLIEYIKNQIECFLLPIDSIIHNCDEALIRGCGINEDYKKVKTLEELISLADFYCGSECVDIIHQFSKNFGQGYIGEQLHLCDYFRNELIQQKDKLKEKGTKEKKLKLALCLSASFSLILLLI